VTLRLVGSDIVHMDKNTFMWVQLTHFIFDPSLDDRSALTGLIARPGTPTTTHRRSTRMRSSPSPPPRLTPNG